MIVYEGLAQCLTCGEEHDLQSDNLMEVARRHAVDGHVFDIAIVVRNDGDVQRRYSGRSGFRLRWWE